MKKSTFTIAIFLCVSMLFAQEKKEKMLLNFLTSHEENPEYVYGKIKEIHYQVFHNSDENGKVGKGKPFTLAESENVTLRQPWSYYYNELGDLVKMSLKNDKGIMWTGVVHHANNRIEKIYWLKGDTLMDSNNYTYLKNGNIENQYKSIQNNELHGKTIRELDKKGYLMKSINQDKEGKTVFTAEYTRNPDGTAKVCKGIDENGKTINLYNDYKYNDKGLFESLFMVMLGGKEINTPPTGKVEYEYDENGNWTKSIYGGWMLIERKIVYYE